MPAPTSKPISSAARIGHVHLKVADLELDLESRDVKRDGKLWMQEYSKGIPKATG